MEIKEKIVVITGGASGIGAATAKFLHQQGAKIIVLDHHLEAAKRVADEVAGLAIQCDVSDAAQAEQTAKNIKKHYRAVHVLINCAGIAPAGRVVGKDGPMPLDDFERVIRINLIGTFNLTRVMAAIMVAQDTVNADGERGVIINTASVAAFEGQLGQAAYSASKGGIVSMTLPIAREFSQLGIRVMTIAPGIFKTPMMQGLPDKVQEGLAASVPFPKRLGEPQEYAKLALHIIENAYLNGSVIRLDAALRMAIK